MDDSGRTDDEGFSVPLGAGGVDVLVTETEGHPSDRQILVPGDTGL